MKTEFPDRYRRLGIKIAYYRKLAGLTQAELAAVLGVTERTLRDWESGVTVPDQQKQKRVMDALARLGGTEPPLTMLFGDII